MPTDTNVPFTEVQKMDQWWLQLALYLLCGFAVYTFIMQILLSKPVGDHPMPDLWVYFFLIFSFGLLYFFSIIRLETQVNSQGIRMKYKPFVNRYYSWNSIRSAEVVKYRFVGYGIRFGFKYGTIYNVKGKYGVSIVLNNGSKVLIGTQRELELAKLISSYTRS